MLTIAIMCAASFTIGASIMKIKNEQKKDQARGISRPWWEY